MTTIEKGVDIKMAIHMIRGAIENVYDVAILVSGDADFAPVVETIHHIDLSKKIEHACFPVDQARELMDICDRRIVLDQGFFDGLLI